MIKYWTRITEPSLSCSGPYEAGTMIGAAMLAADNFIQSLEQDRQRIPCALLVEVANYKDRMKPGKRYTIRIKTEYKLSCHPKD